MDQRADVRFLNSRVGRALALLSYVVCLFVAFANHNWPLGVIGALGLGMFAIRTATGRPMVRTTRAKTREEAIAELYPRRRRALVGTAVAVLLMVGLGVLSILGGARRDDPPTIAVGILLVLLAALLVAVAIRVALVLRTHAPQS